MKKVLIFALMVLTSLIIVSCGNSGTSSDSCKSDSTAVDSVLVDSIIVVIPTIVK